MSSYNIVILLPGTTGTTLLGLNYVVVWPDAVVAMAAFAPASASKLLADPGLTPGQVMGWDEPSKVYGSLMERFHQQNYFPVAAKPGREDWGLPNSLNQDLIVAFPYDWRVDNLTCAASLQALLATMDKAYGAAINRIDLVAHSMGGIVARTYLEKVGIGDAWYGKIKSLITMGTPHLGAPLALQPINNTLDIKTYLGKGTASFDTMAHDFVNTEYDSTYELVPPSVPSTAPADVQADVAFITDATQASKPNCNLFNLTSSSPIYQALVTEDLNIGDLDAARSFWTDLTAVYGPNPPSDLPAYYCIYGLSTVYPTCVGMTYDVQNSQTVWTPTDVSGGGDQIVPQWSAEFAGGPVAATYQATQATADATSTSVNHLQLPGSPDAQAQILSWLGIG